MSRRELIEMLGAAALVPLTSRAASVRVGGPAGPGFRIRTITAGTNVKGAADLRGVEHALAFLKKAKRLVTDAGYEVQTIRIATQPFLEEAGHRTVAGMMTFVDHGASDLERLDAERRAEVRRQAPAGPHTGQPSTSGSDRNS